MIPRRFNNFRPYLASFIHPRFPRPPFKEMLHWLTQPGKEKRAAKYIDRTSETGSFKEIYFKSYTKPFLYPKDARWIDLCQTVDECMSPKNWHHFFTPESPLSPTDIVVDCGAAEGLFSFVSAFTAKKIYAIEPIPSWHNALEQTFRNFDNVEILKCGVGHKEAELRMTNDEIFSRVSCTGELSIPVRTIDNLFKDQKITFLKADIEGFEFNMLLGAEETIRKNKPKIALTVYHDSNDFRQIISFLQYIHPDYQFMTKGIAENGNPVLLITF